ncbi:MAG: hypothetical protein IPM56_11160 [Ignavibacteriales bacterium]|nr:MAG: hypothetical protein IPM56_11160 [Ignavibacteriales bacterium]
MKNLVLVFFFTCIISITLFAQHEREYSQIKLRLSTGLSIPMGDFASVSGEKAGLATPGLLGMLELTQPMSEILDLTLLTAVAHNGLNVYKIEESLSQFISPVFVNSCSYYTTWVLPGLQLSHATFENTRIYLSGNLGLLFSSFPDITIRYQEETATQEYKSNLALGFGLGAGFQYHFVNAGVRYLTGTPKIKTNPENGQSADVPISVLLVVIGVTF